jgi:rhomboid-like protein
MPLWPVMTRYFMHTPGYPRAAQSILNVFSHMQYEHLLANMMMLILVGPPCCDLVGRGTFMATYISAGAVGTLFSLYWANLGRGNLFAHSVGASAAIWGIAALYCLLTDTEKIEIPGLKDAQAAFWPKTLFTAFVVLEVFSAWKKRDATMDHASHFGGMLVGIVTAGYLRANGWQGRPSFLNREGGAAEQGVQEKAGVDEKTVDVGAMAKQGIREVKESLTKVGK